MTKNSTGEIGQKLKETAKKTASECVSHISKYEVERGVPPKWTLSRLALRSVKSLQNIDPNDAEALKSKILELDGISSRFGGGGGGGMDSKTRSFLSVRYELDELRNVLSQTRNSCLAEKGANIFYSATAASDKPCSASLASISSTGPISWRDLNRFWYKEEKEEEGLQAGL